MEAIIQTGGKQYRVSQGSRIAVEKLEGEAGSEVTLDQVLLVINNDKTDIGTPFLSGAKVVATIVEQAKGEKVVIHRYKRRKGYHKTKGHRQLLTRLEIKSIKM